MKLTNFIAKRYLFSKNNTNAINIISGISAAVFTIGTAVMIIILSFLNGLEGLIKNMNNAIDPDLRITAVRSKVFNPDSVLSEIKFYPQVDQVTRILEDNAVVRYGEAQEIARIKGVEDNYGQSNEIDTLVISGKFSLYNENVPLAVFGGNIANNLGINVDNTQKVVTVFVPRRGVEYSSINPDASLNNQFILPGGVILMPEHSDKDLIIVPLKFSRDLFEYKTEVSSLELGISNKESVEKIRAGLQQKLGDAYKVFDRNRMNESAYKVFRTEKWATFAILSFIILIAAFNTVGALTMLVLEKKKDISILRTMGATPSQISKIFLLEGVFITIIGLVLGSIIGVGFVFAQQHFGFIHLDGSFLESFPIEFRMADLLAIAVIIGGLGGIASLYPAGKANQIEDYTNNI
ncbi:MAG: lipoprotein-releasing system permease protein [Bacteroidia bacterium]|jgi:lipoprotein-releasing system permease protein